MLVAPGSERVKMSGLFRQFLPMVQMYVSRESVKLSPIGIFVFLVLAATSQLNKR